MDEVHQSALTALLPALLAWAHGSDVVTSSLLPRLLATITSILTLAGTPAPPLTHLSPAALASRVSAAYTDPVQDPPQLINDAAHLQVRPSACLSVPDAAPLLSTFAF